MNKKGQAETIIDFTKLVINLGFVIVVSVFIVIVAMTFLNTKYETYNFEAKLLVKSLTSAKDCLAYEDIKTKPGIIDINKFSNERLKNCFSNPKIGYKTTLMDLNNNQLASTAQESKLLDFLPICSTLPEYKCTTRKDYVLFFKDNKFNPGILKSEVIALA